MMAIYAISQITDLQQVRDYLYSDPNYAAYAIGDLDPRMVGHTTWLAASRTGEIEGLALIYSGLELTALFLMGDVPALSALLMHGVGPERVFIAAKPELAPVLHDFYWIDQLDAMHRMRIKSGTSIPLEGADRHPTPPVRLGKKDAQDVRQLHRLAAKADSRPWEDIAFTEEMLEDGYFTGIHEDGNLIAVAGTHLVSRQESMAALGNVVVHPEERRRGLGSLVSYATTKALLDDDYRLIVLNVRQDNKAALKIYRKLGYRPVGEFVEGAGQRK